MLHIRIRRGSGIITKIRDFYLSLYRQRLYSNSKKWYTRAVAVRNIANTLSIIGKTFDDNQLKKPIISDWQVRNWQEIHYKNWHFAVIVQMDLFGNNIAMVQDCCHDKDYHNDTMETQPFKMDNSDDQSHIVDWKKHTKQLIREAVQEALVNIDKYYCRG